ncbi:ABC transporter permease [Cloacibacillus evryensis]|uniref:ABC transporter permease n=1 Tax=Cloacibacillus evryensis TaxID=508460 RepID=A0AAW5K477_9BACT|nr:ABC transporter permease [Cloacibacillus evryensis]EXG78425.1 ABC-type multidrug transport system, permease component [Cloacibacillus evryensis DSM 19522]MCQ4764817.1 ABC transporter permease [Cloacibacillus evryensis]MCQ4815441.1 ABC transporter permease [Cloacibacillus evryensis]MEA5034189.1 ABC transporter permease [Cloacibacillus evryensis]
MNWERMHALIVKEFIQLMRDRITLAIVVFMPLAQLLIFGFAINTDIKHLPTVIFDQSRTQESRSMINSLTSSNYFDVARYAGSVKEVDETVESGRAKVGIVFPPDYASRIKGGRQTSVQVIIDATDNLSASSALAAAQTIGMLKSQEILAEKFSRLGVKVPGQTIDMRIRLWYNPDFITSWYIVPGIMGMLLTITLISMMSMAIVRESEQGTLEQLLVTPMKIWELLFSKIIPYIVVGYVQVFISIIVGIFVFNMPFLGSITLFYFLTFFYVVASLSLGIMISCFAQNQTQALQMSVFIILPSVLLSGFVFPLESMPLGFRYLGECLPITYYISLSRQIILKGGGLAYVWRDTLALIAYIAVMFTASILMFKRRFVP